MSNTAIRNALYAVVTAGDTFDSANTQKSRYAGEGVPESTLPQAWIGFVNEEREMVSIGTVREYEISATWEIVVMATAATSPTLDEALDDYVAEIELLLTDRTLGGASRDCFISSVGYDVNSEGESVVGAATITLTVLYAKTATT